MIGRLSLFFPVHFRRFSTSTPNNVSTSVKNIGGIIDSLPITKSGWCPPLGRNENLPFFVKRSATGNLPVYLKIRNGRSRVTTHMKGVSGDAEKCRAALQESFPDVVVKTNISSLEVKGNRVEEIKTWLLKHGF